MASTFEVIESKDVLELGLVVNDGATSLFLALLQEVDEELLNVLWLLITNDGCQVLQSLVVDGEVRTSKSSRILCFLK